MLAKIWAGSLLLLILSPFTAPFSTCDLAILLGHSSTTLGHTNTVMVRANRGHVPFSLPAARVAAVSTANALVPTLPATARVKRVPQTGPRLWRVSLTARAIARGSLVAATVLYAQSPLSSILRV